MFMHFNHISPQRAFMTFLIFAAAYLVTVSVRAQDAVIVGPGDAIQLNENDQALITGTITSVDKGSIIINSASREMKVDLSDVKMKTAASDIFKPGMSVTINGEMNGDDFGMPVVKAKSITASETPTAVIQERGNLVP